MAAMHSLYDRIPPEYLQLMEPRLQKLNMVLEPGITALNWLSVEIADFVAAVLKEIHALELLIER